MVRRRDTAAGLLARAEANGYKRGAHTELDQVQDQRRHNEKTKKNHKGTLNRYVLWQLAYLERDHVQRGIPAPSEEEVRAQHLGPGTKLPDLATVKDFLRFYIHTSQPRLTTDITTDSMGTITEWFFAGFTQATGTVVPADARSEVYGWLRKVLTAEGLLVNKRKPKYNFTATDLPRIVLTVWTKNGLKFTPERYRIQFTFIIRVFCWTGARLGAFFTGGLCYRDVELVLQRTTGTAWKCIVRLDQRWVKNNRDPENIVFGTALQEHDKFIYDDLPPLVTMALADKALFGYDTLADLREQQIPLGQDELPLRWRESALNKPILRKCTKEGVVTDEPMPKSAFCEMFQSALVNAGYLCTASVHSIRRQLGKKVDELYTEVQRSQHLTQADPRVFGQAYVANMSSVDGQSAFLGEPINHNHIDYFQGLSRFRQPGLPCVLPARLEEGLKQDPKIQELEAEIRQCPRECRTALKQSKQLLESHWRRLKRIALHEYQEKWVQDRRDWQIITRGKEQCDDPHQADLVQSLSLLFPERLRLAQRLASDAIMSSEERWLAMEDLYTLCTRDFSVLYLPGHQPVNGRCPVKSCKLDLESESKSKRNQHIQACLRREIASKREYLQSDVHYCHWCFNWIVGSKEWKEHCQIHIGDLGTKRCGQITYCHTLVRPGYCPFCLGKSTSAVRRLRSWCRDHALWQHVNDHLEGSQWPLACPHPLCKVSLVDGQDMRFHFIDEHGLHRTLPKNMKYLAIVPLDAPKEQLSRKRKAAPDNVKLSWQSQAHPPKMIRHCSSTIAPPLLARLEEKEENLSATIDLTTSEPAADSPKARSPWDSEENTWSLDNSELDTKSPVRFRSCDSTLADSLQASDNDLFSQFIRSPSPDCVPDLVTTTQSSQAVVDIDDLTSPTNTDFSEIDLFHHDSAPKQSSDALTKTQQKLLIRLRVKQPPTKIKLRVSMPKTKESNKRLPARQKPKGNTRQPSRKKTSAQRR